MRTITSWVYVEDETPPENVNIIFYSPDLRNPAGVVLGMYEEGVYYSAGTIFTNVTHWMRAPLAPETGI